MSNQPSPLGISLLSFVILVALVGLITVAAWGCPTYNVWQQNMEGQAELARANQNRQIKIAEAKAQEEAAIALAQAEINRAKGVAEANRIIGESLKENEAYLRWLWIEGLKESGAHESIVYVPTEAGIPILEAGRMGTRLPAGARQ